MDNMSNNNPQSLTGTTRANNDVQTPTLEKFGRDLSRLAREGKLTEAIGREKEVQNLAQALSRKMKSNAVLVGGAGVGKTCIVEHLAILINNGTCPANSGCGKTETTKALAKSLFIKFYQKSGSTK
jgi:ATP-dependent Clp protease ATP-binding subunit ClpC